MRNEESLKLKLKKKFYKNKGIVKSHKFCNRKSILIFIIIIIILFILFQKLFLFYNFGQKKENFDLMKNKTESNNQNQTPNNTKIIDINTNNTNTINTRPKIIAITYANDVFKRQVELNKKSALEVGQVDEHYIYGPNDIDPEFREKNKGILSKFRGNGLWLWKPYFIYKTFMEKLKEGDYLIYTDAGILYMNSTYQIIEFLKEQKAEMWMNRLDLKERLYTKRDAFVLMGLDTPYYTETYQYMAGIQIYRKSLYTQRFIEKYLFYSQDKRIISDNPNTQGQENYPGFKENRHDQTVLSLLIKKYGEANSGDPTITPHEINHGKHILMPNIFCIYRRNSFKDYEDLRQQCIKILKRSPKIFT